MNDALSSPEADRMSTFFREAYSYVVPAYFGVPDGSRRAGEEQRLYGGSATLVELPSGPVAVTCAHVIDEFRTAHAEDSRFCFQLSGQRIDVLDLIRCEDRALDLATIDLEGIDIGTLSEREDGQVALLVPPQWPPQDVMPGEELILAGFPGRQYRRQAGAGLIEATVFVLAADARNVDRSGFVIELRRDQWLDETFAEVADPVRDVDVGGLSGCPVFAVRASLEFVGVVTMDTGSADGLRIRSTKFIRNDGLIA